MTSAALTVSGLEIGTLTGSPILRGVSYEIAPGEVLALVGESGSGKTTAGLAALGHFRRGLAATGGAVTIAPRDGEPVDVLALSERDRRALRGHTVSYIPQDPALSLNPGLRIGVQIAEVLETHQHGQSEEDREARVAEVLAEVGLPGDAAYRKRYPHQLSGGQQQRVGIAMAFACRPAVVVLDEPTTGLDVTTQTLVLETIGSLAAEHGVASLYITHDLAVVAKIADRVAVMYRGEIVESGQAREILHRPRHAYTRRLVDAVPDLDGGGTPGEEGTGAPLLAAKGLSVAYGGHEVLRGVDIALAPGESLLLLGESGSGKTTLSQCVSGLNRHYAGSVELDGVALARSTADRTTEQRRDVQYVFQSPFSSLNPRRTIARSVEVPLTRLTDLSKAGRRDRIEEVLDRVRLRPSFAHRLPDQLSGGERQRAAIARALVTTPRVLVCDEVTSALDVSVQATIIDLLAELRAELGMAMVFVTHNIALARHVADRVAVLNGGTIVETGKVGDVLTAPSHPYTRELLENTPRL
ncbi:ABC transporter ATP-binding protein [Amycolatopsis minnesotensis]|uniref:ABC transporter ATP-binding protein n=1 Tax=Amycolatopsis minnesotensis TaxID=337894 RepID=A0ABP5DCR4_9PSEU